MNELMHLLLVLAIVMVGLGWMVSALGKKPDPLYFFRPIGRLMKKLVKKLEQGSYRGARRLCGACWPLGPQLLFFLPLAAGLVIIGTIFSVLTAVFKEIK